jgi:hypothetical protein
MADEQDKPVAGTPAPPPPPPTEPVVQPKRDRWGAVRGLAALTWVQFLAAGLIGGLVGGGVVALFDGDDHGRDDRVMMINGPFRDGGRYFDRGPGDNRSWPGPLPRRWQGVPPGPQMTQAPAPAPATPTSPAAPSPTSTS